MEKLRLGPRPKFHLTWKELLGGGTPFWAMQGAGAPRTRWRFCKEE